jgi:hypothetical protein
MDQDDSNEGSFEIINVIGQTKPVASGAVNVPEPQPPKASLDDEQALEELQRRYLWECTFSEI